MAALYIVFALVGLVVFALAIFGNLDHDFDHHFDFGGHDLDANLDSPGLFSLRTISAFLAGFGVSGLLAKWVLGWGIFGQLFLGLFTGVAFAALAFGLAYILYKQQAGTPTDSASLAGKVATVTVATGSQKIGECRVDNKYYTCREMTNKSLSLNETVKVNSSVGGLLLVEKI
jgi:membrane protein implicated in regulation of membrane protease activity